MIDGVAVQDRSHPYPFIEVNDPNIQAIHPRSHVVDLIWEVFRTKTSCEFCRLTQGETTELIFVCESHTKDICGTNDTVFARPLLVNSLVHQRVCGTMSLILDFAAQYTRRARPPASQPSTSASRIPSVQSDLNNVTTRP
jgi:hypothetical protein